MDLSKLNSATKYPSIETYHVLGEKGRLTEDLGPFAGIDEDEEIVLTEKVDGTNFRIVVLPDGDYFIGMREELIYAKGDRIMPTALNSATRIARPFADYIIGMQGEVSEIRVFFMEIYGSKIGGAAKNYTKGAEMGARMFDVAFIDPAILDKTREEIASWRDHGGQRWATEATLQRGGEFFSIPVTPRLGTVKGAGLPQSTERMQEWLEQALPTTQVALSDNALNRPEGIVLRTKTRSVIAKARFEDYTRTLKRR